MRDEFTDAIEDFDSKERKMYDLMLDIFTDTSVPPEKVIEKLRYYKRFLEFMYKSIDSCEKTMRDMYNLNSQTLED